MQLQKPPLQIRLLVGPNQFTMTHHLLGITRMRLQTHLFFVFKCTFGNKNLTKHPSILLPREGLLTKFR